MNLVTHLAKRAQQHPDRIALIDSEQSLSYADLYSHVCGASRQLRADGLGSDHTVLILQPVGIPLYISILAAFHAGITVMFIDPSAGKDMMRNSLKLHHPDAFIGTAKAHLLRLAISGIRKIPRHYHSSAWVPCSKKWQPEPSTELPPIPNTADSPALITFTSGSTGMPKAACRTHGFLLAQHSALSEALDYGEGEVDLVTLPIFALANLASGLTSVIADTDLRFPALANAQAIADQCLAHSVTRCAASPAFFAQLHRKKMMPPFEAIYTGGAPVFPCLLDEIQSSHPEIRVVTVFGSTEAEPIAHIAWDDVSADDRQMMLEGRGLIVGNPVDATQLLVIPDQSGIPIPAMSESELQSLCLPSGQIGEIIVTGEHVLSGYLHGIGDEENKIHVGKTVWHRTGDAAWLDTQGRVWLMGRCSAKIKITNKIVYPFGIECAAMNHPEVERCALMLDQNQVTLFVQGKEDQSIANQLRKITAKMFVERIVFTPEIPVDKRHNAKIDYPKLRQLVE